MSYEEQIAGKLAEHLDEMRSSLDSLGQRLREALAAIPSLPSESDLARTVGSVIPEPVPAEANVPAPQAPPPTINNALLYRMEAIEYAKNQTEILDALLQGIQDFAQRAAIFVVRDEAVQGWNGFGFDSQVKSWKASLNDDPILRTVASSRTRMLLDGAAPAFVPAREEVKRSLMSPLLLKGKVSALIYADSGADGKLDHYSVDILVKTASLVIDIFPLRPKRDPLSPVLENQAIIAPGTPVAAAPQSDESLLFEDSGTLEAQESEEAPNQTIVADIPEEATREEEPSQEHYEVADVVEEVAPAPAPSVVESTSPSKPVTEPVPPGEEKLHEDAQRFARLLVQEIALYHPREVEQGKRSKNLYILLREDIDRSREAFEHRFQRPSIQSRNYFDAALAKYLADGDPSLLGI